MCTRTNGTSSLLSGTSKHVFTGREPQKVAALVQILNKPISALSRDLVPFHHFSCAPKFGSIWLSKTPALQVICDLLILSHDGLILSRDLREVYLYSTVALISYVIVITTYHSVPHLRCSHFGILRFEPQPSPTSDSSHRIPQANNAIKGIISSR